MKRPKLSILPILVHGGSLAPFAVLVWDALNNNLTANPIQAATLRTGKLALIWLILSLACTPVHILFGFKEALKVRRTLGLYAFFYVSLHFLIFTGLDYAFNWGLLKDAIFEKRYALVGFAAFMILLPMAVTSFRWWMRKLGKNWKRLHKLVYLAGILAIIHYVWEVKTDIRVPLLYGALVLVLLIIRLPVIKKKATNFRFRAASWWRGQRFPWRTPVNPQSKHQMSLSKEHIDITS